RVVPAGPSPPSHRHGGEVRPDPADSKIFSARLQREVAAAPRRRGTWARYGETVGSPSIQNRHGTSLAVEIPVRGPDLIASGSGGLPSSTTADPANGSDASGPC